jgi:heterodisulfide reductase subunit A
MYATKQAMITVEHAPGTECTVFFIDFRAYGKGFDGYYERAKEAGIRYLRSLPSGIRQIADSENLEISYALPDGQIVTEEFEMVVLSVGLEPPPGMSRLASDLGVELTPDGFCQLTNLSPLDTTRQGVYVCGPFAEPKDIPETVMSASAAAARAMTLLADGRNSLVRIKEYPPEIDVSEQPPRIGVFVCHCGTNIAGVVDVAAVADYAKNQPGVVHADHYLFTCSTDSQANIRKAVREHELNRVVVASCTPRTHESLFQSTIRDAGLNYYLFELANIRDQCSWVHRDFPDQATQKANDLVRMAIAKVNLVEPLQRKELEFNHDALVIGGGLAGMTAALELASQGFQVSLVEKERDLGGNMRHLQYLLSLADPQGLLRNLILRTMNNPNIHLFLDSEVATFEGSLGNFKTSLRLGNNDSTPLINVGVVIVATGAVPYQPTEYLYGEDDRVLTQMELEQILVEDELKVKKWDSVVMIQCVGSRNAERPYCSRLCCSQAVKNALVIKDKSPDTEVYILYRDIRTYGLLEKFYRKAREKGVVFIRFEDEADPHISQPNDDGANARLSVAVHDAMLDERIELKADRVVLSVATVPHSDASHLAQLLKVPLTQDGFFQEAHLKLAPVDFATEGIFLCGMAHYPKKAVTESVIQAKAAAGRAATILSRPVIEISPTISHVLDDKCDGCAYCVDPCPYKAITLVEYENEAGQIKKRVVVDEALCKGCGTCQATCPKDAIYVSHFKLNQLRAMTMAALER